MHRYFLYKAIAAVITILFLNGLAIKYLHKDVVVETSTRGFRTIHVSEELYIAIDENNYVPGVDVSA